MKIVLKTGEVCAYTSPAYEIPVTYLCKGTKKVYTLNADGKTWDLRWTGPVPVYIIKDKDGKMLYRTYKDKVKDGKYTKPKPSGFAIEYLGAGKLDKAGNYVLDGKDEIYNDKEELLVSTLGMPFVPWQRTVDTAFMILSPATFKKHIKPEVLHKEIQVSFTKPLIEIVDVPETEEEVAE